MIYIKGTNDRVVRDVSAHVERCRLCRGRMLHILHDACDKLSSGRLKDVSHSIARALEDPRYASYEGLSFVLVDRTRVHELMAEWATTSRLSYYFKIPVL